MYTGPVAYKAVPTPADRTFRLRWFPISPLQPRKPGYYRLANEHSPASQETLRGRGCTVAAGRVDLQRDGIAGNCTEPRIPYPSSHFRGGLDAHVL